MRNPKRVLLIGGTPKHLRKAADLGLGVVYVQFEDEFAPEQRSLAEAVLLTDYTDWRSLRPLVESAYESWGFSAAVSLTEPGLDPAARVNDLLGLGGTPYEVSHRFTDKWLMRRRLAEGPPVGSQRVAAELLTEEADLDRFGAAHGYPFIVKPTSGTASFGVVKVDGADALGAARQRIRRLHTATDHPLTGAYDIEQFMMEEYVPGPLYSVETFSFDGRHVVLTVTEAITRPRTHVHVGHALPARLSAEDEERMADTARRFLRAMGFRDGPAHTEIILSARGPVICESQNRVGGALLTDMIDAVYGCDAQSLAISWALGLADPLPGRPVARGAAASWLVVAEEGRVERVEGVERVRADPDTLAVSLGVGPGDLVRPLEGQWDGLGHISALGPDTDAAVDACRRNLREIRIHTRAA
ncbi:ATP-grasp domain-containing protein [Streptomyces sp. BH-SS-21]|uniref:ATP-grasp domain-containing protein n=1 Tax=Streptomyces liliiviolaceus TaxID=2823109 RepID=A0A940YBC5_9ACTN|nr:ATP-grasp domain-containing protein [Streptomyces liliiviolaceus]MBQ0853899.1 ATP-grasp domain-containing protein [Streptomyces liliiviolaceus]